MNHNNLSSKSERGQALIKHCSDLLEKAELKVKQLTGDGLSEFEDE